MAEVHRFNVSRIRDKISFKPCRHRVLGIFSPLLWFGRLRAGLKKFSISLITGGILTPEKFFQRGTLESTM
jgi:hypothetical protein